MRQRLPELIATVSLEKFLAPFSPPTTNIVDRLRYWAAEKSEKRSFAFLSNGVEIDGDWTFAELDVRARAIAEALQRRKLAGERALLLYSPGLDFIAGFFGCLFAGVIAVPAFPPRRNRNMERIEGIAEDASAKVALTTTDVEQRTSSLLQDGSLLKKVEWISTDALPTQAADQWKARAIRADDLAFLQYTSGSTGSPKGVMISHGNIMANCSVITQAFEADQASVGCSWLPTYHDMGLIGGVVNPLFCGCASILLSPMQFLQKPIRWLNAISKFRVTISGGPNFAYDLCTDKIDDDELDGIDLSTWKLAFNGAEPVRRETLERFHRRFEPFGFRREAAYPCYGMAETTLFVAGGARRKKPTVRCFDGTALDEGRAVLAAPDGDRGRYAVGCGAALPGDEVAIVEPDTRTRLSENRIGEIWVSSESVAKGYWDKPESTAETFYARIADESLSNFLRTGDLGFIHRGEVYVTGRIKDLIIVRGVNRYPQDIEMTAERAHPRVRSGATAAFSVEAEGRERLVLVCEVERREENPWDEIIAAIRRDVTAAHELPPEAVILVRSGSIPKTSSGKIQRHACRRGFLDQTLMTMAESCLWGAKKTPEVLKGGGDDGTTQTKKESSSGESTTEFDRVLRIVMQQVRSIGKERVGQLRAETNIVELGLDSLERMEIINGLEEHFGGQLPEAVLPEIETCSEVAHAVLEHLGDANQRRRGQGDDGEIPDEYYRFGQMTEYKQLKRNMQLLEQTGLPNPYFQTHESVTRDTTVINGRRMLSFSSYNYLGMSGDPIVSEAAAAAAKQYGTSVSASRLVSGQKPLHEELENEIADFVGTEAAIVYVGGHSTNESTIGHLFGAGDLILHDALSHNSIIQGAILSGARRRPFPHNDWEALDQLLTELRPDYRRVLVVVEGVYSMDGDYPNLPEFIAVKKRHKTFLMVDEAHSIGTMGETGRGISEYFGVDPGEVDLWMGTLSKSFGSCGGYIAGCREVIEYLKFTAPGFVYSVGLPPSNAAAALASIRLLRQEPERARTCIARAEFFLREARQRGLCTGLGSNTPVVPVVIGNSAITLRLSHELFQRGINVLPILYPAVEESGARLRFFITSTHTEQQILETVDAVVDELQQIQPSYFGASRAIPTAT